MVFLSRTSKITTDPETGALTPRVQKMHGFGGVARVERPSLKSLARDALQRHQPPIPLPPRVGELGIFRQSSDVFGGILFAHSRRVQIPTSVMFDRVDDINSDGVDQLVNVGVNVVF